MACHSDARNSCAASDRPRPNGCLKLVLHETSDPHHDDAIRFIRPYQNERFDVVLPTLWRYEIGNVLGLKASATAKESTYPSITPIAWWCWISCARSTTSPSTTRRTMYWPCEPEGPC